MKQKRTDVSYLSSSKTKTKTLVLDRQELSCLSFLFCFFPILNLKHFHFIYKQPKRTMQEQRKYHRGDSDIGFKNYDCSSFSQLLKKVMTSSNSPGFQVRLLSTFMCINGLI
jgi:hypothetical protein